MEEFRPFCWEKEKKMAGSGLSYRVRLQDYVLTGEDGAPEASMFSYSYLRDPAGAARPVMFCYNGGPGAASGWLHMGLLGPQTVSLPGHPELRAGGGYRLEENAAFLADVCDIVLIDPVGTGYARLLDGEKAGKYYSTAGDAAAFARFISDYLRENGREDADIYLLGESYGTIRNVALADALPGWVKLRGIVSIGTSLNVGARGTMYVEPNVRRLGANAAACWYHRHRDELPLEDFVGEALSFAYGDYARALLMGSRLPESERDAALDALSRFSGLDREFLSANRLRFGEVDFLLRLCPGEVVSAYDSRLTYHPGAAEGYEGAELGERAIASLDLGKDAFMNSAGPAFERALGEYSSASLAAPDGREYRSDMLEIARRWDYRGYGKDTLELPRELMEKNEKLRFLFVNGYYDLMSTFDFVLCYLAQYGLPPGRTECAVLPSGHAAYVGEGMAQELSGRIREFVGKGS